jgi:3-methylfumaryl-CoA hydratase
MSEDLSRLKEWIGRTQTAEETVSPTAVAALAATLDCEATPRPGDPLPAPWHWIFFNGAAPMREVGPDGHPRRGGFLPPVPLPRRMWAGGRLTFHAKLRVGETGRRESEIVGVEVKKGRSGDLVFVNVRHRISGAAGLAIDEQQDLVYRGPQDPTAPPPPPEMAPTDGAWRREIKPDPVLLFRYSALTFNGHRIHYDHPYATKVENYPGLVVHGPLIATLLLDLLARSAPNVQPRQFTYRAMSPLFDTASFTVNGAPAADGRTARLWATGPAGQLAMRADIELAK